jgi:hypothetical protein
MTISRWGKWSVLDNTETNDTSQAYYLGTSATNILIYVYAEKQKSGTYLQKIIKSRKRRWKFTILTRTAIWKK